MERISGQTLDAALCRFTESLEKACVDQETIDAISEVVSTALADAAKTEVILVDRDDACEGCAGGDCTACCTESHNDLT